MRVLVVDDEKGMRDSIRRYLELEKIDSDAAENGHAAQRMLEQDVYSAAVVDLRMPGMDGLELLAWIREQGPRVPVVMISAHGEIEDALRAMKLGAYDYVVKPFDPEELVIRLRKAVESRQLRDRIDGQADDPEPIGSGPRMRRIAEIIRRVADTPSTVLITGESGTGKEVVARAIHQASGRADGPFVPVNVGGMPETLLESELFGYERGAFTGAEARKPGLFELAGGGTLFLDEIGDMPVQLQVKLLRVLQDHRVMRLGGTQPLPVDARIISATNRDLEAMVAAGGFREDLYYRLNVVRIEVPPLRERREDLPELVGRIVRRLGRKLARTVRGVDAEALEVLRSYPFPGNIRELENLLERAIIFGESDVLTRRDLDIDAPAARAPAPRTLESMEREAIVDALRRWEGNRTRAAEELGIGRRTLQNKIRLFGLQE